MVQVNTGVLAISSRVEEPTVSMPAAASLSAGLPLRPPPSGSAKTIFIIFLNVLHFFCHKEEYSFMTNRETP